MTEVLIELVVEKLTAVEAVRYLRLSQQFIFMTSSEIRLDFIVTVRVWSLTANFVCLSF